MSTQTKQPEIFFVWSDDIDNNRIDAKYWIPEIRKLEMKVKSGKYKSRKLGEFITDIHYGVSTSNDYVSDGIPFLRILNLKPERVSLLDVVYLPESARKTIGRAFVKGGDLLISRSGSVGIVNVMPKEADGFAFGSFMIKFQLNDEINKDFVAIWLNSESSKKIIEREKIGAIQGNITIDTIKNFDIPFPPISEQQKIVDIIRSAYTEKRKKEAKVKEIIESIDGFILGELGITLEKEKKQMTFEIWSDEIKMRIDPSFFRPIFETLDNAFATTKYKTEKLSDLSSKITSGATPLSKGDAYTNTSVGGIPFVRSGDINTDNKIDFDDLLYLKPKIHNKKLKGSKLQKGDLLIAIVGATIGQISVYDYDREANINQAIALVRLDNQKINSEYTKEFMFSSIGQMQLERTKRPVARANINLDEVGSMKIIYPSKRKQDEMVRKIQEKRAKIRALRTEADVLVANAQKQVEEMILDN